MASRVTRTLRKGHIVTPRTIAGTKIGTVRGGNKSHTLNFISVFNCPSLSIERAPLCTGQPVQCSDKTSYAALPRLATELEPETRESC